jgi:predicted O-methyltransferase YrrM
MVTLIRATGYSDGTVLEWSEMPAGPTREHVPPFGIEKLDIVPVNQLAARLSFNEPLFYPVSSQQKPAIDWRMEVDDAPIFRYLYRNFQPRRHLEFGTWHGAGALYCLEECSATIWTINLPDGEVNSDGTRAYEHDEGMHIGRLYREPGLGNRVCQILCNSREWDISNYPAAFFDSVLIDGGHDPDTVAADTLKALALLRSGGLCLWHDFCPDPAVILTQKSSRGVVEALLKNWKMINSLMKDVFWIQPSYILLGIVGSRG